MIVKPHSGRCRNVGIGVEAVDIGPAQPGVRGLSSQTISAAHKTAAFEDPRPATLFANSQVPSGTFSRSRADCG